MLTLNQVLAALNMLTEYNEDVRERIFARDGMSVWYG
jgi:hypothetical protein